MAGHGHASRRTNARLSAIYARLRPNRRSRPDLSMTRLLEVERQASVDDVLILRSVLDQAVRSAEAEVEALAHTLDQHDLDRHEPLVGDVVVDDRILAV